MKAGLLKDRLSRGKGLVENTLARYLPAAGVEPEAIHRAMRYSVFSGGKRIRPAIVMESARTCGGPGVLKGKTLKDVLACACAVELAHTYSLIHDDLPAMDDDDYRRGKPSCHKRFGEAAAILAGDGLLTLAFNILARHVSLPVSAAAAAELSEAIGTFGMVGGQALDIAHDCASGHALQREKINKLKTARLFEASAKLGAISARASSARMRPIAAYGANFGLAFQAVDDLLDDDGCAAAFGKAKARRIARRMADKAKDALKPFGDNADGLRYLADNLLSRAG